MRSTAAPRRTRSALRSGWRRSPSSRCARACPRGRCAGATAVVVVDGKQRCSVVDARVGSVGGWEAQGALPACIAPHQRRLFSHGRAAPAPGGCNTAREQPAVLPLARRRAPTGGGLYAAATLCCTAAPEHCTHLAVRRHLAQPNPAACLTAARLLPLATQGLFYTVWPVGDHMYPKLRLKYRPNLISLAGGMQVGWVLWWVGGWVGCGAVWRCLVPPQPHLAGGRHAGGGRRRNRACSGRGLDGAAGCCGNAQALQGPRWRRACQNSARACLLWRLPAATQNLPVTKPEARAIPTPVRAAAAAAACAAAMMVFASGCKAAQVLWAQML